LSVRVSCQTIAFITGSPVLRSHTTVVSRWLVMPSAAMSPSLAPALSTASSTTFCDLAQISCGSCSTHPGLG
jgi:hypothetical protein